MAERFSDLPKFSQEPAARLLAAGNAKLNTEIKAPASASVGAVLEELDKAENALVDMLRLITLAMPARERVWWACLAARDVVGPDMDPLPRPLLAAEKWVYKPSDENREAAREAGELADPDDQTALLGMAVSTHDGKLGIGDQAEMEAPPGASAVAAFAVGMYSLKARKDVFHDHGQVLIDRAIDIAQGGNGSIDTPDAAPEIMEEQ